MTDDKATAVGGNRIERVYERIDPEEFDALLFFDMRNIRYLTGFTGSDGVLLLRPDRGALLVDGRYITQAAEQSPHCEVVRYADKVSGIAAALTEWEARRVGFEASALTVELYERIRERVGTARLTSLDGRLSCLRGRKDAEEISSIRRAIDIATETLTALLPFLNAGWSEREIALELDCRMRALGSEENSFPTIVASGPNAALPHARPGNRVLAAGDPVIIDFGAVYRGYRSDETCSLVVGRPDGEYLKAYAVVKEAHDRAIAAVRAGVSGREIDGVARRHIEERGYGPYFTHGTGHGVGLDVHEDPRLSPLSDQILAPGMVVTVEPGIYLPGRWGIRIEDMVLVGEDGCEVLTRIPKELRIIGS
ncbi:MAG: Xaa-Pro peptidase family protein [Pseudomonadota bacterium]|nr:Xaa-Pro peptidase family protein [Pseudomonadota bacterium]